MKLLLKRIALRDTYTIGKIYIDGEYFCDTLEDNCVTVRFRDTMEQERIKISELKDFIEKSLEF